MARVTHGRSQTLRRLDPRGSTNLRVCSPYGSGWHTQGRKDEFTSCRGTVQSKRGLVPPVRRTNEGGKTGLSTRVNGRHVVLRGRQIAHLIPATTASRNGGSGGVREGNSSRLVKTDQNSAERAAAHPGQ